MTPQDRVKLGIAFVPQTKNVFTGMTVEENLEMGAFLRDDNIHQTINQVYDYKFINYNYINFLSFVEIFTRSAELFRSKKL